MREMRESREERRGGGENSHYGHKFNTWVNCFPSKILKYGKNASLLQRGTQKSLTYAKWA